MAALVVNKIAGSIQVAAVKAPGTVDERQNILHDLAILTGGNAIAADRDLTSVRISDLGQARKITIDKNSTVVEGRA